MTSTPTVPTVLLNSGAMMPTIGLGTYEIPDADVPDVVRRAARIGYRLIDTAARYGNERGVGEGVRTAEVPREEFFVVSKVRGGDQGYDATLHALEESLRRMGLDHLDLYLIHWPLPRQDLYVDTWRAMARLAAEGRVRSIGVSNFTPAHLDRLEQETGVVPAVNQVQINPRLPQTAWQEYAATKGIVLQSWGPLGHGGSLLTEPVVHSVAERHGRTPGQAVLRWHLDNGLVPIPKTVRPVRLAENFAVFDFRLTADDHASLDTLAGTQTAMDPDVHEEF
ncbi:aldo/keto reductase [Streptomyces sp. WAC06614]|uniref:aldo/keto reductase n=1 Tax=Streptomyces sp. WAC06614 TaxID=2487416 RepID=UPI000F776313|nr:aldo/keto reductase [Streptomyces sp. WAC06614]RSS83594.1 aldo/keto reductase [Streptomyces sp. WAC06614]